MRRALGMAGAALCLLVMAGRVIGAQPSPRHEPGVPPADAAGRVTAYMQEAVAPYVWSIESALNTANKGLLAYCGVPAMGAGGCAEFTTHEGRIMHGQLRAL